MRKLTAVAIALVGLLVLAHAISMVAYPLSAMYIGGGFLNELSAGILMLIPVLAEFALAAYLIRKREKIAAWYVPEGSDVPPIDVRTLMLAGLVVLGVYLVVQGGTAFVGSVLGPFVNIFQMRLFGDPYGLSDFWQYMVGRIPTIATDALTLAAGLYLLSKREQLADRILTGEPAAADDLSAEASGHCPHCGAPYEPEDYEGGVNPPLCEVCKGRLDIVEAAEPLGAGSHPVEQTFYDR